MNNSDTTDTWPRPGDIARITHHLTGTVVYIHAGKTRQPEPGEMTLAEYYAAEAWMGSAANPSPERHPAGTGACPEDEPCGACAAAYAEPDERDEEETTQ